MGYFQQHLLARDSIDHLLASKSLRCSGVSIIWKPLVCCSYYSLTFTASVIVACRPSNTLFFSVIRSKYSCAFCSHCCFALRSSSTNRSKFSTRPRRDSMLASFSFSISISFGGFVTSGDDCCVAYLDIEQSFRTRATVIFAVSI